MGWMSKLSKFVAGVVFGFEAASFRDTRNDNSETHLPNMQSSYWNNKEAKVESNVSMIEVVVMITFAMLFTLSAVLLICAYCKKGKRVVTTVNV